jgi:hypothetical protein
MLADLRQRLMALESRESGTAAAGGGPVG